ncbi:hypothetical protein M885DRAFT_578563 [Pelagophyceae sp. CCMP2097]|nr:hypothetical protein M885DRAFT_578563 [Pelagophyceae sp. CCMP2097]
MAFFHVAIEGGARRGLWRLPGAAAASSNYPFVPTLSGGVAVGPVLGLDVQHLAPLVPTLPDGAVDPALGLDVPLGSTLPDGAQQQRFDPLVPMVRYTDY